MDFQRFGIDPRLAKAAEGLPTSFFFYEKMLSHAVELQENVCVKIALDAGREEVLLMPALQWLLSGEERKLLVVVPDSASAGRCSDAIGRLGSAAGLGVCRVSRDDGGAGDQAGAGGEGAEKPPTFRLEGDPSASVLIGMVDDLLGAPALNLRDYGFLVVDGVDRLAELPPETVRRFCACLLPSWERRSALACSKFSIKVKNLAWDLADNPSEISIEGEVAKAQSVLKETWKVPVESKVKFLLGLIVREKPVRLCVFCNLKDTASDLTRRLAANGIASDTIFGPLSPERKFALIEKFRAGDSTCLVLSDEGADGLTPGVFPLVVNYDIPLEPELFVKRLEMLDRSDPGAKVVSLACDRYIYGLPAVEQYIDAKLDLLPAEESMLSAVDRSEARGGERRQRENSYPRDARRAQPQKRDANRREDTRREDTRRNDYPRSGPDIRKSISEATGGALEMGDGFPPDSRRARSAPGRQPANRPPAKGEPRRGQVTPREGPTGSKDGKREDARPEEARRGAGKASSQRGPQSRHPASRSSGQKAAGPGIPGPGMPGNPYDMPIEDRMKLYRERYGRGLGENEARKGQKGQGSGQAAPRGGQRAPGQVQRPQVKRGPSERPQAPRGPVQGGDELPSRSARVPEAERAPEGSRPGPEQKPAGFVSRIIGGLRKKKG
jgi:ATP-dependent RNA helicase RhlB